MSLAFEGWCKRQFEEYEQRIEKLEAVIFQLQEAARQQKPDDVGNWISRRQEQKQRGRI